MPKKLNNFSIAELERMLDSRKSKLDTLLRKRTKLSAELEETDKAISALGGRKTRSKKTKKRKTGKRLKNAKTLHETVKDVLAKSKNGYPLATVAEKARAAGYKSKSTDFRTVVYQSLYGSKDIVHDKKTGIYKLK